jgi:hypothetical protein
MNRRDFLFLGGKGSSDVMDVSCEQLYMRWVDSEIRESREDLVGRLREEIGRTRTIRFHHAFWLNQQDLREVLEPLLQEFSSRGGTVEYL